MYSKILIYSKLGGAWKGGGGLQHHSPKTPSAAKFASQGDAHVRMNAQIKFLYYPPVCVIFQHFSENLVIIVCSGGVMFLKAFFIAALQGFSQNKQILLCNCRFGPFNQNSETFLCISLLGYPKL